MILLLGDIQGCDDALARLMAEVGFSPSRDHLVVLGDLVNRGPQSLQVLQRLSALGNAITPLLGNHDLHLLAAACGVRRPHRDDTVQPILVDARRDFWLDWLRHGRLATQAAGWLCVHAGVPAAWTRTITLQRAAEVEACLQSPAWAQALQTLYGNQPTSWDEGLQGAERRRYIINALTRMRWCAPGGAMDLRAKEGAAAAPSGLLPWFELPQRQTAGEPVAFGHWSTLGLINRPDLLALDTGCVWGGQLTAARVDGGRREIHQVACPQARRPG
jgi:bis(5'-nucleosyl)-tetraphosphatase (symmetrical)